jgi:hypothetical protein
VWLWFRQQGLRFPLQSSTLPEIRWITPSYTKIHQVLTNPVYAGAYVYGKTRQERYVDDTGRVRKRLRHLPRSEWSVVIRDHHPGFIDWQTFEANQLRLAQKHPSASAPSWRSGERRRGAAAGDRQMRTLRARPARLLQWPQFGARLLLCGQHG